MTARLLIVTVCFLATAAMAVRGSQPERVALREPLEELPLDIGRWKGREAAQLSDDVLAVLGVDEYVNRVYGAVAEPYVSLYVGYYQSQREGDTIHSPMNCLPGAGWRPVSHENLAIPIADRAAPIVVNRYVIQKGADRQVVLYWYQSHGRVVANEYMSKIYLVVDAVRTNRSDAALVRVISPVLPGEESDEAAERRTTEFVQAMFPFMEAHLPS
jgi:EpsI family protein